MKAVLLAAGKGKRLGELTETTPKPMLPVLGKPLIVHNIEMCRRFGINNIYINLHHLPEVITDYLGDGKRFGVAITYSREETILGTAGGVKRFAEKLSEERFFVIYADNHSNYDLGTIYDRHCKASADMSIALFEHEGISQSGVAWMDEGGWIYRFVEKPKNEVINSPWVNAGIYLMEPKLLDLIPAGFSDFGRDVIPRYITDGYKILGVQMPTPVLAIDTPALIEEIESQAQMNKDMPLVSVLITTCNSPDYLDRCLSSVLYQNFKNYEILIMDDQPNAETKSVVKKYEPLFAIGANYRHIRNEPHLGFQRSLNRGLREARGEYIARLDDDDTWAEVNKLSQQVEFLEANAEYVLVGTNVITVDENGTELSRTCMPEHDDEIRGRILGQNCIAHSSVMFRKSAVMKVGGYIEPTDPLYSEDHDLWLKLGALGKLANLPIYGLMFTGKKRGIGFTFRQSVVADVRFILRMNEYKDKYPHYWRAVSLRFVQIFNVLLHIISDIPPFVYLKRFLKNKYPAFWQAITSVYRGVFRRVRGVIRLSK